MKKILIVMMINASLFLCCSANKELLHLTENQNGLINFAIKDFLRTEKKLSLQDSAFSIRIKEFGDSVLGIGIWGVSDFKKLAPNQNNKIGTNYKGFPTNYVETNDKLFYWFDSTQTISKGLIQALSKYRRIDSLNVNGFTGIPDSRPHADRGYLEEEADYYFCKCKVFKFKKIITKVIMGSYPPPKLKCPSPLQARE